MHRQHDAASAPASHHCRYELGPRLDKSDGMPDECALSFDNLDRIDKTLFRERITRLSAERMHEVCRALAIAAGCA